MDRTATQCAHILFALAEPTRLQMLQLLNEHPMSTEEFTKYFNIHENTANHHARILRDAGLIEGQRNGKNVKFHIVDDTLNQAIDVLNGIATH